MILLEGYIDRSPDDEPEQTDEERRRDLAAVVAEAREEERHELEQLMQSVPRGR